MPEATTVYRNCPFSEAACGLAVDVGGDSILQVRGDREDCWIEAVQKDQGSARFSELIHPQFADPTYRERSDGEDPDDRRAAREIRTLEPTPLP